MAVNLCLAAIFALAGLAGSALQYWLWTFPMEPDPTGTDPNGRTTAPLVWRRVHRALGYIFIAAYLVLLVRMWARLEIVMEGEASGAEMIHAVLGLLLGPVLGGKIFILRKAQKFGKQLRTLGTLLLGMTMLVLALIARPALQLANLPVISPGQVKAKAILTTKCVSCHGATRLFSSVEDWDDVVEDMEKYSAKKGTPLRLGPDRLLLIGYLADVLPGSKQRREEDDDH